MKKMLSLGQAIKGVRQNKFSNNYFLYGNDIFMQDFFIEEFKQSQNKINSYLYYLGYDKEESIFNELSNLSLFDSHKLIIIKNINRLTAKSKSFLLEYLSDSKSKNYLILVKNNFDSRNKFVDSIMQNSVSIDVRTPFESKMKEWVRYIIKKEKIDIEGNKIDNYIDAYGDNISNVMNYIKIDFLSNRKISNGYNRNYYLWHLQDSIGKKDLNKSISIYKLLLVNGNSLNLIILYIFSLYEYMHGLLKNNSYSNNTFFINKIIKSRIKMYSNNYSISELENIILKLKELDFLSKNSTINIKNLKFCLFANICAGYYE